MKRYFGSLSAVLIGLLPFAASASVIDVGQVYGFGFGYATGPLTAGSDFVLPTNPDGIAAPAAPWTFTLDTAGTLTVLDLFGSTDQFEIFDDLVSLGQTSTPAFGGNCGSNFTCALGDMRYSRGIFDLSAGSHSITGLHIAGVFGGGALLVQTSTVPVPATLALLLSAIGLLGVGAAVGRLRGA